MRFIDLFAGLGGFHKARHELGNQCVFASKLSQPLRTITKPIGALRQRRHSKTCKEQYE